MKFVLHLSLCLLSSTIVLAQEPPPIPWTPVDKGNLQSTEIIVPKKYTSIGINSVTNRLNIPPGWRVSVFAYNNSLIKKPRFMSIGPGGVLYVACMSSNRIVALPDMDRDGVADTVIVAATTSANCHDVKFLDDTMYTSAEAGVTKLWRSNDSGFVFNERKVLIDKSSQPNQMGGGHRTRTLVLDPANDKLYVSVGSVGNALREMTPGQERGVIEQYNMDGTGRRVYAFGIRNGVGLTLHPRTGKLWGNCNGSDEAGADIPPEWVDIIRENGFYGYPYAYFLRRWMNFTQGDYRSLLPMTHSDTVNVASMVPPAGLVMAHCAPMALQFSNASAPVEYRNGLFMAMRGSWNREPPANAKVVYFDFDNDSDTIANKVADFITGFLNDTNNNDSRWARPVGLCMDSRGALYVSLDEGKECILKLTPPVTSGVDDRTSIDLRAYPNPTHDEITVDLVHDAQTIELVDLQGIVVYTMSTVGQTQVHIDVKNFAKGMYILRAHTASGMHKVNVIVD